MILVQLFLAFLKIGIFAVGGAYSFLPLLEKEIVDNGWLAKEEFLDVLGIANTFPGAISIKYATYTGYKLAGIPGVIAANLGNLFAPVILIIFASSLYMKYKNLPSVKGAFNMIEVCVFALIIAVALQSADLHSLLRIRNILIIIISLSLFIFAKVHPALLIISAAVLGAILR